MMGVKENVEHHVPPAEIEAALVELAAELGRIPNTGDWREWDDAPCNYTHIRRRYDDDWTNAIEAAGLPVVPTRASAIIRQVAYQRPDLAASPEVGD